MQSTNSSIKTCGPRLIPIQRDNKKRRSNESLQISGDGIEFKSYHPLKQSLESLQRRYEETEESLAKCTDKELRRELKIQLIDLSVKIHLYQYPYPLPEILNELTYFSQKINHNTTAMDVYRHLMCGTVSVLSDDKIILPKGKELSCTDENVTAFKKRFVALSELFIDCTQRENSSAAKEPIIDCLSQTETAKDLEKFSNKFQAVLVKWEAQQHSQGTSKLFFLLDQKIYNSFLTQTVLPLLKNPFLNQAGQFDLKKKEIRIKANSSTWKIECSYVLTLQNDGLPNLKIKKRINFFSFLPDVNLWSGSTSCLISAKSMEAGRIGFKILQLFKSAKIQASLVVKNNVSAPKKGTQGQKQGL